MDQARMRSSRPRRSVVAAFAVTAVLSAALFGAVAVTAPPGAVAQAPSGASEQLRAQTRTLNRAIGERTRDVLQRLSVGVRAANLRAAPAIDAPIVGVLAAGTPVDVTGEAPGGQWYAVDAGGRSGYVWKDLLASP